MVSPVSSACQPTPRNDAPVSYAAVVARLVAEAPAWSPATRASLAGLFSAPVSAPVAPIAVAA